jgi:hypothetical protein
MWQVSACAVAEQLQAATIAADNKEWRMANLREGCMHPML